MQSGNGYGSTSSAGIRNSSFIASFVSSRRTTMGYDALHGNAAWLEVSNSGKIVVQGPDRARIVDSLVSNDVQGLQNGGSCYAFFLNHQGYVLADATYCMPARRDSY
jgi:glycine cleavage system aminomethyltransferase T